LISLKTDICLALVLGGCTTTTVFENIYLLRTIYEPSAVIVDATSNVTSCLREVAASGSYFEGRVGYFGICVRTQELPWLCSNRKLTLLEYVGMHSDPLGIIDLLVSFRTRIIVPEFM